MAMTKLNLMPPLKKNITVNEPVIVRRKQKVFAVSKGKAVSSQPDPVTTSKPNPQIAKQPVDPGTDAIPNKANTYTANEPGKPRPSFSEIVAPLTENWPELFDRDNRRPLKIGIIDELFATKKVSRTKLRKAMSAWCRHRKYQAVLAEGGPRYGLDGLPAGEVTSEQQEFAKPKKKASASAP